MKQQAKILAGLVLAGFALAGQSAWANPAGAAAVASPAVTMATVVSQALARGHVIAAGDIEGMERPVAVGRGSIAMADAIGMATRRPLPAGTVLRAGDLAPPALVTRGENVMVEVVQGPLRIASTGRALDTGPAGAGVRVLSAATNKTLHAVVTGPGSVRVNLP